MFTGTHQHALDAKGRVILPARFREQLAGGLYLTPGQDHCVDVYPVPAFEQRVAELRARPREDRRARAVQRVFLANAHLETPDGQGRVTIPPVLREYAGLTRDLAVVGADDHIEIWDHDRWEQYLSDAAEEFSDLTEAFAF